MWFPNPLERFESSRSRFLNAVQPSGRPSGVRSSRNTECRRNYGKMRHHYAWDKPGTRLTNKKLEYRKTYVFGLKILNQVPPWHSFRVTYAL